MTKMIEQYIALCYACANDKKTIENMRVHIIPTLKKEVAELAGAITDNQIFDDLRLDFKKIMTAISVFERREDVTAPETITGH